MRERFRDGDQKIEATKNVDRLVMIFCGWERRRKWKKQFTRSKEKTGQQQLPKLSQEVITNTRCKILSGCNEEEVRQVSLEKRTLLLPAFFCLLPRLPSSSSSSPQRVTQLNAYTLSLASPPFFFFLNFSPHSYLATSSTLITTGLEKPCPA